jgi:hypothetical protein
VPKAATFIDIADSANSLKFSNPVISLMEIKPMLCRLCELVHDAPAKRLFLKRSHDHPAASPSSQDSRRGTA